MQPKTRVGLAVSAAAVSILAMGTTALAAPGVFGYVASTEPNAPQSSENDATALLQAQDATLRSLTDQLVIAEAELASAKAGYDAAMTSAQAAAQSSQSSVSARTFAGAAQAAPEMVQSAQTPTAPYVDHDDDDHDDHDDDHDEDDDD